MNEPIKPSELILNDDGSVYHLHLRPEHIATDIITVGDPDRVAQVSKHFDSIEFQMQKREFCTHTGYVGSKRLTVISTGIGTDNIDIVLNELDALVNIDLYTRKVKDKLTSLRLIRVGTSGTLQKDIPVDSMLLSSYGLGLDGMLNYYELNNTVEEEKMINAVNAALPELPIKAQIASASQELLQLFKGRDCFEGITVTATGFYGPQGRVLRAQPKVKGIIDRLANVSFENNRITNLEMETAGIYGLGRQLGHHCLAVNAILANRPLGKFSTQGSKTVKKAIELTLDCIVAS